MTPSTSSTASRKPRPSLETSAYDPAQLTTTLRAQLKAYAAYAGSINSALKDVNQIHTELDVEMKPINLVKGRLDRAYDLLGEQTAEEIKRIDAAIETLDILINMRSTPVLPAPAPVPIPLPPPVAAPPAPTGNKRGPYKKKIKLDSAAPSPIASAAPSPLPYPASLANSPSTSSVSHPRAGSAKPLQPAPSHISAHPSPAPSSSSSAVLAASGIVSRKMSSKSRKDALLGQLPLHPGRQVAFRQPVKGGPVDQRKEEWILARVVNCIQGDKNRYAVEDVDYDPSNPTPEGGKYNTTLKSIVPLPDRLDPHQTYPEHDYSPGTQVMALYPDTTSFYRAVIQSGPTPVAGATGKKKDKEKVYKLIFDDDDNNIREIPVELVVEIP